MDEMKTLSSTKCVGLSKDDAMLRRSERAHASLLLYCVTFERERDQSIDQRRIGDAARGPQLREHADRREARHRVDLVDEQLALG